MPFEIFLYLIAVVLYAIFQYYRKIKNSLNPLKIQLPYSTISVIEITNEQQCHLACLKIRGDCLHLNALGFDCEWITVNGGRRPVALLQLATVNGLCYLFRLNILKKIPLDLERILYDSSIIKLGVTPLQDSKLLNYDYGAEVCSTLDLRYLYPSRPSLGAMAASEIGITLNKDFRLRCSDWEVLKLSDSQKEYAAKDAFVAVEIFKKWLSMKNLGAASSYQCTLDEYYPYLRKFLDINFSPKIAEDALIFSKDNVRIPESGDIRYESKKAIKSSFITRKSPLYHNCFMHAPDGELLCSCDRRKAEWYVERGLAKVLPGEPYSIKLLFEPAARSGDTAGGRFYQHLKQNCCVVCGRADSYLKHNVVPKEYRKHFPSIMKEHQSHDIVLMCVQCHLIASQHNEALRNNLAIICNAPITVQKVTERKPVQEVKNSARALINAGNRIPLERKLYLENIIKKYYKTDILTEDHLKEALKLQTRITNDTDESHGLKVVNYFLKQTSGLKELELLWRKHFLQNMKPQYLPALWSVNHNHNR